MSNYTGNKCPVCHKAFTDQDDIVVCPDCGTPYHRACWPADGHCVNADKHGTGFEWKPENAAPSAEGIVCPACGAANPPASRFCCQCGAPLAQQQSQADQGTAQQQSRADQGTAQQPGQAGAKQPEAEQQQNPNYRVFEIQPDDPIEGVKARDWAAFFGPSAGYYLVRFQGMAVTGRKFCVSVSAFLFGPLYFLYRKAWKPALFFAALSLLLEVPGILTLLYIAGGLPAWLSSAAFIGRLAQIGSYVNWIQMFLRGVFGVYLYRQAVLPKVQELCRSIPEGADRQAALRRVGGTSVGAMFAYLAVFALMYLAVYLYVMSLGPSALTKLTAYAQQMMNYLS